MATFRNGTGETLSNVYIRIKIKLNYSKPALFSPQRSACYESQNAEIANKNYFLLREVKEEKASVRLNYSFRRDLKIQRVLYTVYMSDGADKV
jgi:hypothetical protein